MALVLLIFVALGLLDRLKPLAERPYVLSLVFD
jgi:hypothetical protein